MRVKKLSMMVDLASKIGIVSIGRLEDDLFDTSDFDLASQRLRQITFDPWVSLCVAR